MVRLKQIAGGEQCVSHAFNVIMADRITENLHEIFDTDARKFHLLSIVKRRMQPSRMNVSPSVPKSIAFKTVEIEITVTVPLKNGDLIIAAFEEQIHGLAAQLLGIVAVE